MLTGKEIAYLKETCSNSLLEETFKVLGTDAEDNNYPPVVTSENVSHKVVSS